jgi:membrane-associated phospholipid phosphatase
MPRFRHYCVSAAILAAIGSHSGPAAAVNYSAVRAGDVMTGLLPLYAFSLPYFKDDSLGKHEWLRDTVINEVLNTGLRAAFNSTSLGKRPNGGKYAFPSGHAGFVFSQATFLMERYGWHYGAPAVAVAAGVCYIRVAEDKHHWRDIIAGGALAYGVSLLTVTPEKATHLAPIVGPDFLGLRWERSF